MYKKTAENGSGGFLAAFITLFYYDDYVLLLESGKGIGDVCAPAFAV